MFGSMISSRIRVASLLAVATATGGSVCLAESREVHVTTREQLDAALASATPGTSILLAPGTYRGGIVRRSLRGTEAEPIVIASADPEMPATIEGGPSGIHLSSPEHVTLRDLVLTGQQSNGLNVDDGGSPDRPARHVALERVTARDIGPDGNRDGFKLSGLADFRIDGCVVERWGKSGSGIDMVGCRDGVVTNSRFSNPDAPQSNGVQTKGGSRDIVVRRCVFLRAGGRGVNLGGSTGLAFFRPEPRGFEAKDVTVEDCTFVGSMAPIAFVGCDGAIVRHCTIFQPERWCVRILQENQGDDFVPSRNGRFENNVIAFSANRSGPFAAVNVGDKTASETFVFEGNVWFCLDQPKRTGSLIQPPMNERGGRYDVAIAFDDLGDGGMRVRDAAKLGAGVRPE